MSSEWDDKIRSSTNQTVWPPAPVSPDNSGQPIVEASRPAKERLWQIMCGILGSALYQIGWTAVFLMKVTHLLPAARTGPNTLYGIPDILYYTVWGFVSLAGLLWASLLRPSYPKTALAFSLGIYIIGAAMLFIVFIAHQQVA